MGKLILIHPSAYVDEFIDLVDGYCTNYDSFIESENVRKVCKMYKERGKIVILNNLFYEYEIADIEKLEKILKMPDINDYITYFIGLESNIPNLNLRYANNNILMSETYKVKTLLSCWGELRHIEFLASTGREVGLPFKPQKRQRLLMRTLRFTSKEFWYLGYRNLSEIKYLPPKGIITGAPITCSILGLRMSERSRRPKNLPMNIETRTLDRPLLVLAKENVKILKGALNAR